MHDFFIGVNFDLIEKKMIKPPINFNKGINDKGFTGLVERNN